jgi:uncharacterized spore protein YtfJ
VSRTMNTDTSMLEKIREVVDGAQAGRVFGTPIQQDGVVVLPVAKVKGGGGGGGGTGQAEEGREGSGSGAGMGVSAKPLGVFVVKNGKVRWQPAVDINKVILGAQIVAITALVTRVLLRARHHHLHGGHSHMSR